MPVKIDLLGQRFGRLLVTSESQERKYGQRSWNCLCDCGRAHLLPTGSLRSGQTQSCGCLRDEINRNPGPKRPNLGVVNCPRCNNPRRQLFKPDGTRGGWRCNPCNNNRMKARYVKRQRIPNPRKICACGAKKFRTAKRCGACHLKYIVQTTGKKCEHCGDRFVHRQGGSNKKKGYERRFCSSKCFGASRTAQKTPPKSNVHFLRCRACDKPFTARLPFRVYCSNQCKNSAIQSDLLESLQTRMERVIACKDCGIKYCRIVKHARINRCDDCAIAHKRHLNKVERKRQRVELTRSGVIRWLRKRKSHPLSSVPAERIPDSMIAAFREYIKVNRAIYSGEKNENTGRR